MNIKMILIGLTLKLILMLITIFYSITISILINKKEVNIRHKSKNIDIVEINSYKRYFCNTLNTIFENITVIIILLSLMIKDLEYGSIYFYINMVNIIVSVVSICIELYKLNKINKKQYYEKYYVEIMNTDIRKIKYTKIITDTEKTITDLEFFISKKEEISKTYDNLLTKLTGVESKENTYQYEEITKEQFYKRIKE